MRFHSKRRCLSPMRQSEVPSLLSLCCLCYPEPSALTWTIGSSVRWPLNNPGPRSIFRRWTGAFAPRSVPLVSFPQNTDLRPSSTIPHDGDLSLLSLRDSIDQLKSEIRDQFAALRLSDFQSPGSRIQHEAGNDDAADAVDPETGKENEKAPVALVRQINATLMGFPSRKFFDLSQDVVLLGLLTEEQAQLLSST